MKQDTRTMSSENMDAEYRSGEIMSQIIPTNRIRNIRNIARQRCCSFCREAGHTINLCNDQRLIDFDTLCHDKKSSFENERHPIDSFQEWLLERYFQNQLLVRAYAISMCGSTTRASIENIIDTIMIHFYGEQYDLPDLIENTEYIPFPPIENNNNDGMQQPTTNFIMYITWLDSHFEAQDLNNSFEMQDRKFGIATQVVEEESETPCECNICYESFNVTNFVKLNCEHEFCKDCLKKSMKACGRLKTPTCAYCRAQITNITYRNETIQTEFLDIIA